MIAPVLAAALRCPPPAVEQDLSGVYILLAGLAGLAIGKVWGDRNRRLRIMGRRQARKWTTARATH